MEIRQIFDYYGGIMKESFIIKHEKIISRLWYLVLFAILMNFSFSTTSFAGSADCSSEALSRSVMDCQFDFNCITRVTAEYNEKCNGNTPSSDSRSESANAPPVSQMPAIPGMPQGMGDMLRQMQECGGDQECLDKLRNKNESNSDTVSGQNSTDSDTTSRIYEQTILPSSWLQSYQNALINCGNDAGCMISLFTQTGQRKIDSVCGTNLMDAETAICKGVALLELHIEQAIAQQIIASQNKNKSFFSKKKKEKNSSLYENLESGSEDDSNAAFSFLPQVSITRVNQIVAKWKRRLESDLPEEGRRKIKISAADYPLETSEGTPPLIYEETETRTTLQIETKPTRRDWAFALIGTFLTDAGMETGGKDGSLLLDHAMWSLIQAAELKSEASHYSAIGFHLNLRGKIEEARDILVYARTLESDNADTDNNLAFSYSALGKEEEAEILQQNAVRLDPENSHIRSRLNAMLGIEDTALKSFAGDDFGEAFYRLSKRQLLREYKAENEWQKQREFAQNKVFGSTPPVPGSFAYYKKDVKDINADYKACAQNAPKIIRGCPHGDFILHPDCKNLPSKEQVDRSRHNHNVHMCECQNHYIQRKADAITAYLNAAVQEWTDYEEEWWPRLNGYKTMWLRDIKQVNASYSDSAFQYPLQASCVERVNEFQKESEKFWTDDIRRIYERWYKLKSKAQSVKTCKTRLPPIEKKPKPPLPKPEEKETTYSINLLVFKIEVGMEGSMKTSFDLGIIKGGYERNIQKGTHKFTVGSGSVDVAYETGRGHNLSMTVGANFLKFIPGAGAVAGDIASQFVSFGAKHKVKWSSRSGFSHSTKVENKLKFGYSVKQSPIVLQN